MSRTLWVLGIAVAMVTIPMTTTANHLSAGYEDTVAAGPEETPEAPSVAEDERARGLETDCYDPRGNLSREDVQRSVRENDAFCGQLVYAEGTNFTQESPPDQVLHRFVGTFDVVTTYDLFAGSNIGCVPWCKASSSQPDVLWNGTHIVGNALGLTDGPSEAKQQEEDRSQHYHAELRAGTLGQTAQRETNAWEMNGWIAPAPQRTFVAWLEDSEGNPISDDELEDRVAPLKEKGVLGPNTAPTICGWLANANFTWTGTETNCQIDFTYKEPSDTEVGFDGYDDECESPTYVCGAVGGAHWVARGFGVPAPDQEDEYFVWHWLVAPHPSPCGGIIEPRVGFGTNAEADLPFLAHDLDVYTPLQKLRDAPHVSTDGARAYSNALQGNLTQVTTQIAGEVLDGVGTLPIPPEVNDAANDTVDEANAAVADVENASYVVSKDHRVEPNAKPAGSLEDTSQQNVQLERSLGGGCNVLQSTETPKTADPWVDIIDGEVVQSFGSLGVTGVRTLYGNTDKSQDHNNAGTAGLVWTAGHVGVSADKDDDGDYEWVGSGSTIGDGHKYQADTIRDSGAYPLLWDMWLNDDGTVKTNAGCEVADVNFPELMQNAGYGPNTALVQAIYLREPTVFYEHGSLNHVPYPAGNNVYLLMSQSARTLYDNPQLPDNPVDVRIDQLVSDLKSYVSDETGIDASEIGVEVPAKALGASKAFAGQCTAGTGGFGLSFQFTHACAPSCAGDTIVTMYTFEALSDELGGQDTRIPQLTVEGTTFPASGAGQYTWYDVDPFDGDPDRNREESSAPPT